MAAEETSQHQETRNALAARGARPQAAAGEASDQDLVERFRRGDDAAFETLRQRYDRPVCGYLLRKYPGLYRGDRDLAREDYHLALLGAIATYQAERGAFRAWLFRWATWVALAQLYQNSRGPEMTSLEEVCVEVSDESGPDPLAETLRKSRAETVRAALAILGVRFPKQRLALVLAVYEELTYEEIARAMRATVYQVRNWINRGKKHLAGILAVLDPSLARE